MKILVLDIETAPIESYHWKLWDENIGIDQIKVDWSILSFCAKWLGKKVLRYEDTSGEGPERVRDDTPLLEALWKLLDEADIVVAQNGKKFDIKKINARMVMEGYKPYSPIKVVDTLSSSRKHFGFTSNRLEYLSRVLTNTPKSKHRKFPKFELWSECLKDNPEAWAEMRKYNIQDVIATENVYKAILPWIDNHPNVAIEKAHDPNRPDCLNCGSNKLQKRGIATTRFYIYDRYHCQKCGAWHRSRQRKKDDK